MLMATMYPKNIDDIKNRAERELYNFFKDNLEDKEIVCYYNYDIKSNESDFIIVIPGYGICVIEVKDWITNRVKEIIDNTKIKYVTREKKEEILNSPLNQAKNYCYKLREKIKEKYNENFKVIPLVCFPYITETNYENKRLDIVSPKESTILKDDLENLSELELLLKSKLNRHKVNGVKEFEQGAYIKFCSLFEEKEKVINRLKNEGKLNREIIRSYQKRNYSILESIDIDDDKFNLKDKLDYYFNKWIMGTKIILIVKNTQQKDIIMNKLEERINQDLTYLENYNEFKLINDDFDYVDRIFNFEIYYPNNITIINFNKFSIVDGVKLIDYIDELKLIDKYTKFNCGQYKIEHAKSTGHLLVKAGAGTGKTYSMVSRVAYLYYVNNYLPNEVVEKIAMITFTNESSESMKEKLKQYFTSLSILTESNEYLHIVENISKMKISTIHSFMKSLIEEYSIFLGLGNSIKITTKVYDKREAIEKKIDDKISKDEYKEITENLEKYQIIDLAERFIDLCEKKNINLAKINDFQECNENKVLFELIKEITNEIESEMFNTRISQNEVSLSNLMLYAEILLDKIPKNNFKNFNLEYMFIDEFQDTDDKTIQIISKINELSNLKFFIVGDIKQSIYRFRGADDSAFDKLQNFVKNNWICDYNKNYFSLNKNYRSDSKLLISLDNKFKQWSKEGILKYNLDDVLIGNYENQNIQKHFNKVEYQESDFELELIKCIKKKKEEIDKNSNENSTIAILTRTNKELDAIRSICVRNNIDIETDKVENLYKTHVAIDLYRLLLALQYNNNSKHLYNLTLSNYTAKLDETHAYINRTNRNHIVELFNKNRIIKNWAPLDGISKDESILGSLKEKTILRVIRKIIKENKPWDIYANKFTSINSEVERIRYKRNLELLLENIVRTYKDDYITITKLTKYLEIMIFTNKHEDERSLIGEEKNKVKIKCLTIHKSKGLEYEHVIIPYTSAKIDKRQGNEIVVINNKIYVRMYIKDSSNGDNAEKIESFNYYKDTYQEKEDLKKEETRILYVALTRAKYDVTWFKLIIPDNKKKDITWGGLLSEE